MTPQTAITKPPPTSTAAAIGAGVSSVQQGPRGSKSSAASSHQLHYDESGGKSSRICLIDRAQAAPIQRCSRDVPYSSFSVAIVSVAVSKWPNGACPAAKVTSTRPARWLPNST